MIKEIISLGDTVASEICTPRVDMITADSTETVSAVMDRMRGTGYSRLPIKALDNDEIIGIAHYKDLMSAILDGMSDSEVAKYAIKPKFIPESKNVIKLLEEMQAEHIQMAIVIDEYGGVEGLITVEDIVEEIVDEIVDETDNENKVFEELEDGEWRVDGRFPVDEAISLGWPVQENEDYETIAGWLMSKTDSVPESGDSYDFDGFTFKIEKMRRNRIQTIKVSKDY